jgi:hypothetical protein
MGITGVGGPPLGHLAEGRPVGPEHPHAEQARQNNQGIQTSRPHHGVGILPHDHAPVIPIVHRLVPGRAIWGRLVLRALRARGLHPGVGQMGHTHTQEPGLLNEVVLPE